MRLAYKIKNAANSIRIMDTEALKQKVIECLQTIFDPEIPVIFMNWD